MDGMDVSLGLHDTHVVITGAAGQIGLVMVKVFLQAGCFVTGLDLHVERAGSFLHDRLHWHTADVRDEQGMEEAFEAARSKFGPVSACVAAAGLDLSFIPHHESICEMPVEQWRTTLDVNATGTFLTARTWLRGIREYAERPLRNISLVIIGSEAGVFGVPGSCDYAASKAAIQYGLTRSIAPEAVLLHKGARVNAVAPGPVLTPQFAKECKGDPRMCWQESEATVAMGRGVDIDHVAKTCLVLTSENLSASVNGQVISVDGGKSGRIYRHQDGSRGW